MKRYYRWFRWEKCCDLMVHGYIVIKHLLYKFIFIFFKQKVQSTSYSTSFQSDLKIKINVAVFHKTSKIMRNKAFQMDVFESEKQ